MISTFSKHTCWQISLQPNQADNETDQHRYSTADIWINVVEIEDKTRPQGTCDASQAHEGVAQSHCHALLSRSTLGGQ